MIPVRFDYTRPSSVDDALSALADEDAKVLAGGQSLIPLLRMRLAAPTTLVDLGAIDGLRGVHDDGDSLVIGAMTTYACLLDDPRVALHAPLLAQAVATVADRQVRHLGTLGGGLSHADPAGDLPATALALDATMEITGPSGPRWVPAGEFFVDYLTSVLEPGEVLTAVRVPKRDGWDSHYEKFQRVAQSWALVGVAAMLRTADGGITEARVALTNMGPVPVRAVAVESALVGAAIDGDLASAVAAASTRAADGTSPADDVSASAEYRTHLAKVLTERAVLAAIGARDGGRPTGDGSPGDGANGRARHAA